MMLLIQKYAKLHRILTCKGSEYGIHENSFSKQIVGITHDLVLEVNKMKEN